MTRAITDYFARLPSLIALVFSGLLHIALIFGLSFESKPTPAKLNQHQNQMVEVHLLPADTSGQHSTSTTQIAQSLFADATQQRSEMLGNLPPIPAHNADDQTEEIPSVNEVPLNQYYSSKHIDRKALPLGNVDVSQLQGEIINTFPMQFRVYIDDKGKVKRIEQLAVLEQDKAMADKLAQLLYDVTFIPAKKNGVEVNSFQDIEFSLKPTINETTTPVAPYSAGGGLSK